MQSGQVSSAVGAFCSLSGNKTVQDRTCLFKFGSGSAIGDRTGLA